MNRERIAAGYFDDVAILKRTTPRTQILPTTHYPLPTTHSLLTMYERFDHTADLGLRIRAADLNRLFEDAGRALFSAILANPESVRGVEETTFRIEGTRHDDLLVDWLGELLWTFETRKMVFGEFDVRVDAAGISASARGEPIDLERHELDTEIKAITYHGLKVEPEGAGWLAEVIVDL